MMMPQEQRRQDQKYRLRRVQRMSRRTLSSAQRYHAIPTKAAAVIAVGSPVISTVGTLLIAVVVVISWFLVFVNATVYFGGHYQTQIYPESLALKITIMLIGVARACG
jgi:hypothetical protein